ncbi:hypothetical protein A2Z67_00085 [Candidatus Woesebacteria bacterium RBG_13_36_22]|uniref:Uncharacterized protein n=1 Tax=Candidatus Woesebacteria bacterium RBG_13_36_22 TaxID=1802478 RepID=A0A1F7X7E7_9BACT|nr:MAG: hypothetical protein A2Z67_00085 [Candidatus Woesebacteria bacterium RBG_13_36_22]
MSDVIADEYENWKKKANQVLRLKNQLFFYKLRIEELEKHIGDFPEPYKTMICNILANGKIGV